MDFIRKKLKKKNPYFDLNYTLVPWGEKNKKKQKNKKTFRKFSLENMCKTELNIFEGLKKQMYCFDRE